MIIPTFTPSPILYCKIWRGGRGGGGQVVRVGVGADNPNYGEKIDFFSLDLDPDPDLDPYGEFLDTEP